MSARLVVSLYGIGGEPDLARCARFAARLDRLRVGLSVLVPASLLTDSAATDWLRERVASGDALVLHGLEPPRSNRIRGLHDDRRRPRHEAGLRLTAVNAVLDAAGLGSETFAPLGGRASTGTLAALRAAGFGACVEPEVLRDLRTGRVRRSRVRTLAGFRSESARCRGLRSTTEREVRDWPGLARLAISAEDLGHPTRRAAVHDAIDLALLHGAVPATYPELVAPPPAPPHSAPTGRGTPNPDPLTS
ncbi:putative deacetylase [Actinopolyspora lacussalsi]|nr:putative deacetylase [Actinopolyspora lacussalsi]